MTKIHGIVLSVIRHNDRHNIITLYTAERGRVPFLSPVGKGKTGALRNARLAPLALIETEVNFKNNKDLQSLGSFTTPSPWRNLYFDPVKATIVFFLSEFLNKMLRTAEADAPTWRFITSAVNGLDNAHRGLANFHIAFLIRYMHIAGIAPDYESYNDGCYFDMRSAEFTNIIPAHRDFLQPDAARLIPLLMRINSRNLHLYRLTGEQRRHLINIILRYYSLHLPISTEFKSLDILSDLFT